MTKQEYTNRMTAHQVKFEELRDAIVKDTNDMIEENGRINPQIDYQAKSIEYFADEIATFGAWIRDRVEGRNPLHTRANISSKIRKALGYYK